MGKFIKHATGIKGLYVIETILYKDERGHFFESYNKKEFEELNIFDDFIQDNESFSKKGVLRGLHYQLNYPQTKLVRVINGKIFDVVVDLRENSITKGDWYGIILSSDNNKQLYIPKGFAHGFLVLSEKATVMYKVDDYYHPNDEAGIIWNDQTLGIDWPLEGLDEVIVSTKDKKNLKYKDCLEMNYD